MIFGFYAVSDFVFGLKNDTSMGIGLEKDTLLFDVDFWFFRLDFCLEMVDKSERMDYNIIKAKQTKQGVIFNGM